MENTCCDPNSFVKITTGIQLMNKAFLLKLPVITKTFLCKLQAVFNLNLNKQ